MSSAERDPDRFIHSKLAQFILNLQQDSKLLEEFRKDPDPIMINAGITLKVDRDIIKSGDLLKVRELLTKGVK